MRLLVNGMLIELRDACSPQRFNTVGYWNRRGSTIHASDYPHRAKEYQFDAVGKFKKYFDFAPSVPTALLRGGVFIINM